MNNPLMANLDMAPLACAIWGQLWSQNHVYARVLCDNAAVTSIINSKTSRCKVIHLLRYMHFFLAFHNVTLKLFISQVDVHVF